MKHQASRKMAVAVERLNSEDILALHKLGLSLVEIARRLGVSKNLVNGRLARSEEAKRYQMERKRLIERLPSRQ